MSALENWIKEELTVNVENELSKYKERVKSLIRLTPSGDVMFTKGDFTAKQKIVLYLIGKIYSKIAGFSKDASVSNKELAEALGLPEGTVKNSLFALRKEGLVIPREEGIHHMKIERIGIAFANYFGDTKE